MPSEDEGTQPTVEATRSRSRSAEAGSWRARSVSLEDPQPQCGSGASMPLPGQILQQVPRQAGACPEGRWAGGAGRGWASGVEGSKGRWGRSLAPFPECGSVVFFTPLPFNIFTEKPQPQFTTPVEVRRAPKPKGRALYPIERAGLTGVLQFPGCY